MQRIGERTARALKLLAGLDRDEPASSFVWALYTFLFVLGMLLFFAWITDAASACAARAGC